MTEKPMTLWGIPVIASPDMPHDEIRLVVGRGVVRQDATLEWDGDVLVVKNIGEPYDA